ncbi:MAG: hypothetical protein PHW93_06760 [Candidatus Methanomethylophilaceae archaeon]|nr:hypothetical protein [Candidatus Methanomethylophilaceae archaeon]
MSTPDDLSKQCIFIDCSYKMLESMVMEFYENDIGKITPCKKAYPFCLYCFLKDNSYFNLLDILEKKYKQLLGNNVMQDMFNDYNDIEKCCPVTPAMRNTIDFKSTHELLMLLHEIVSILVYRYHFKKDCVMEKKLVDILTLIYLMESYEL